MALECYLDIIWYLQAKLKQNISLGLRVPLKTTDKSVLLVVPTRKTGLIWTAWETIRLD